MKEIKITSSGIKQAIDDLVNENERLKNIINKIDKLFECDTHCENIYYAIGVLLKKEYFEIEMIDNEEILNILGVDKNGREMENNKRI